MSPDLTVIYGEKSVFDSSRLTHRFVPFVTVNTDGALKLLSLRPDILSKVFGKKHVARRKVSRHNKGISIVQHNVHEENIVSCDGSRPPDEHSQYMHNVYSAETIEMQEPASFTSDVSLFSITSDHLICFGAGFV